DEEGTLLLMQAYADLGDLPAAVRAYETHRQRLWDDLGLAPRPDLTAFYDRLRAQEEREEVRRKREGDHRAPPASGDLPYSRDRV
ncbi:MAG TPA: hypothetical protein ENK17_05380, partial [Anaerolineae bacterium]|nr:hypothetical protein [Anaerolineae bacterium]